jgi:hypothetical protein
MAAAGRRRRGRWRESTGLDAALAAVTDYRPGWWPADTSVLFRRAPGGLVDGPLR